MHRNSRPIPALLVFMLGLGAPAQAEIEPHPNWTPAEQEIIAVLENGPMGIETDFDAWANEFHDDWTVWFAGQPAPRAKADHMPMVREYIESGARVASFTAEFTDIEILGEMALARLNATEELVNPDGSTRIVRYASTELLERQEGAWKVRASTVAFLPEPEVE